MRLLHNLLPLLQRSVSPRIISIFAAGHEGNFYPEDLSLRTHYGLFNNISHVAFMTTFFFEEVVAQHPKLSCLHVYPGLVKTSEFENGLFPAWLKWFFKWIMLPLLTPWCISLSRCGEIQLTNCTSSRYPAPVAYGADVAARGAGNVDAVVGVDGKRGSGVYAVNWNGETFRKSEAVYDKWRKKDMRKLVWDHTMDAFKAVEEGRVFEG